MRPLRLDLPADVSAIAQARAALADLDGSLSEQALADLRLLVSEVVTNAIRHSGAQAGQHIRLLVEPRADGVRVEVHDEGPGFEAPEQPEPREQGTSGWGLYLVQRLARRWGVEPAPGGHVWFVVGT